MTTVFDAHRDRLEAFAFVVMGLHGTDQRDPGRCRCGKKVEICEYRAIARIYDLEPIGAQAADRVETVTLLAVNLPRSKPGRPAHLRGVLGGD